MVKIMNVLLFTHISDIDGLGSVILAKLAFKKVTYILCETFELQEKVNDFFSNHKIYQYDRIYITDLWLEDPFLSLIAKDKKLKGKVFIFDHHESFLSYQDKYDFAFLNIQNEKGKCSGTSLFYEYLKKEGYFSFQEKCIENFVELTRRYDTWEWKNKYQDEKPHELSLLFDAIGIENYINFMYEKLQKYKTDTFSFNEEECSFIQNQIQKINKKVKTYSQHIYVKEILSKKAGIVFIDYEYRNDLTQYLRDIKYPIDFLIMIVLEKETISYRSINENINVREVAEFFGGKGHDTAASSKIKKENLNMIIESLLEFKKNVD